ncbi:DUF2849 domain-containing protein [Roseinatronobacter bogoriensis]|uniref:DUF2849 domain-containing protein n=1 Tax=Roseinatronobacter bogoriensis subsp. barguzinensis TaxID=441209 RepID=A0A2K8KB43_9RHOB|nr:MULTISPECIES: DUF2849 domain-containing protein [Rhodobaca]ATX66661.1 DUF2849 domain-containing protein [Rhodobaca barguzinensis]MBB4207842.1 hypothetical protein [Rhodobaca bogoriensis DSM 18756]TDW39852.1 uncharacterized protein DUF2849 [Rhodobaca barguzinensis]TDY70995.1 uncharacterized protein DUF2849 [Rhodobaca bogoriensis DSM 18756]
MSRDFTPSVLTANDLFEGDVVYLTASGGWSRMHTEAQLFHDADAAAQALAAAQGQPERLVGPYLAPAHRGPNGPEPAHFREAFRARGPSNYRHGKQADGMCRN